MMHLKDVRQLLLLPLTFFSGLEQAFIFGDFTAVNNSILGTSGAIMPSSSVKSKSHTQEAQIIHLLNLTTNQSRSSMQCTLSAYVRGIALCCSHHTLTYTCFK